MAEQTVQKWHTTEECAEVLKQVHFVLKCQCSTLDDVHNYAHRYGGVAGGDVYEFLLRDALRLRGLTLKQFQEDEEAKHG